MSATDLNNVQFAYVILGGGFASLFGVFLGIITADWMHDRRRRRR